ncbi:hypothetical protein [Idiomarina aquatica]|uniref:Uncharacterized protein n=1 Tax=Idiomarina aquatica TaxID=1327752 RepID=A0AA94EGF9_9GAMM|nr:hypothetical protein [Idiomarina aquatica]RUO44480.1 hypothetical protein CWE23_00055 [Idiomarina aquatica]
MKIYKKDITETLFSTLFIAGGFIVGSSIMRSIINGELTFRDDNLFVFIIAFVVAVIFQVRKVLKRQDKVNN